MASPVGETERSINKDESNIKDEARSASVDDDALVARLPAPQRIAFVMRERYGLSDRAIATRLRVDIDEVRRLIHEARRELRRLQLLDATGGQTL